MNIRSMYKLLEDVNYLYEEILLESSNEYKKLVKMFHPDAGGDTEIFKAITKAEQNNDIKTLQNIIDNINDINKIRKYLELNGYLEGKKELSTELQEPFNKDSDEETIESEDVNQEETENAEVIKDNREGASEEYRKALENQYALIQKYKECIITILNKRAEQELSKQEKKEILILLNEWEKEIDEYYNKDKITITIQKELKDYIKFVNDTKLEIKDLRAKVENVKSIYKVDIFKIVDKTWDRFKNIITAKLPKGIIQTIMYSNPYTALIADNWDIVSNVVKAGYDTVKDKVQKNNRIKK